MNPVVIFLIIIILLVLGIISTAVFWFLKKLKSKGQIMRAMNMDLFQVSLPKGQIPLEGEEKKSGKEMIAVMEQLFASLSAVKEKGWKQKLYGQVNLCLEIALPSIGEEIAFYYACPRKYADTIEKQIHGFYPGAEIQAVQDYNIFNPQGAACGAVVSQEKKYILPFKTYQDLEVDPLGEITTALSKLQAQGEGAAIQIILKSASGEWVKPGLKVAQLMQQGKTLDQAINEVFQGRVSKGMTSAGEIAGEAIKGQEKKPEETRLMEASKMTPLHQQIIEAIEAKTSKQGFEVNIRLLASAASQARAEQILSHLEKSLVQFSAPSLNTLKTKQLKRRALKKLIYNFSFRNFDKAQKILLNTEELSSIYHFPLADLATPKMAFVKAKSAVPPTNMPQQGLILGRNVYRGAETQARLEVNDRRRHLYIIGQTGVGKSSFLQELIRQDMAAGYGVSVIDPHGDLVEACLGLVPPNRIDDVIYFDPGDTGHPMGLNMLEYKTPEQKDFAVQEMIRIWEKLFPPEMIGPMFEHNMRNAMLTLMADKEDPGTIVEIPRIFTDDGFVRYKLRKVSDPLVRGFWEKEMAKTTAHHKSEMLGYLISKVGRFVENEMMRNIIGQPHSAFDFRDVMDKQKILLLNLSKGRVGEINSSLLGLVTVSKLQMAAMSRGEIAEEARKDFYLYLDEFQNFITDSIATILSEARKYRLSLTIAHQFIGQLSELIRDAVFGNVGSQVAFRVGADDAEFLVKQFEPVFNQHDLINLDNFNAYVKLMINNQTSLPFNMATYPPQSPDHQLAEKIRRMSRLKYSRDRTEVEKEILERSQLGAEPQVDQVMTSGERNS